LWLPRILGLAGLTGILCLTWILWLPWILGLSGRVRLTSELLELLRVLRLLPGELRHLPGDRWVLGLTRLTRERCWYGLARHGLARIERLDRLPRQLARILKLAWVLRLLPGLRLLPRKIHLLTLRLLPRKIDLLTGLRGI